jgi:SAM-dependent methyltransferase
MLQGKSYTTRNQSISDQLRQILTLKRHYNEHAEEVARVNISEIRHAEECLREAFDFNLRGRNILEIGPGQLLGQLPYLALHNDVIGVDFDVVPQGFDVPQYFRMLARNGMGRTVKTIGRKLLGVDRRYRVQLRKELAIDSLPNVKVQSADVMNLPFSTGTFDFVYTRAVFQHLPNPACAIREIIRVLRDGGIAFISLQPYTSPTACLDPRVLYGGVDNELGLWPHLRPELKDRVRPNASLNKLGLMNWKLIFRESCDSPRFVLTKAPDIYFPLAAKLKDAGHLSDYSLEELTTGALDVMFRKPITINQA